MSLGHRVPPTTEMDMTTGFEKFDDDLDAFIASPASTPSDYQSPSYDQPCEKCRGTGQFVGYTGRVLGPCFACQGSGKKTFKTSPEKRERAATQRSDRREKQATAWAEEHKAEYAWLTAKIAKPDPRFDFPQKMVAALANYGSLTDGQLAAVRKLIARDEQRKVERSEREANAEAVDTSALERAFATAKERAQRKGQRGVWLKPLPLFADGATVTFQPGSEDSKWAGIIFVKAGDRKLGQIKLGRFFRYDSCTDAEAAAVVACMQDPEASAKAYGNAWSKCCVCGQTLTNDGSIERGIGPICAKKYGW